MISVGIDASTSRTGVVILAPSWCVVQSVVPKKEKGPVTTDAALRRTKAIVDGVLAAIHSQSLPHAITIGAVYYRPGMGGSSLVLAGLHECIRLAVYNATGILPIVVTDNEARKAVLGRAFSTRSGMSVKEAVERTLGLTGVRLSNDDEADAYVFARYGAGVAVTKRAA